MTSKDKDLLFKAGIVVGGYFLILKPILVKLGFMKSRQQLQQQQILQSGVNQNIQTYKQKEKQTKTDAEWMIIANQIYNDLRFTAIDDNKADAGVQVARVKNNIDFWLLYKFFGERQEYAFGIPVGGKQDLNQFIVGNLSTDQIVKINDNYRRKGIKFQFR